MTKSFQKQVSILIPTYNRASLLKRAIDSALGQSTPCEIVVCDHGSSDSTPTLCHSYGERIKYVRLDHDLGIHFAELHALLESSGKYIHFCFDDDWMHPNYISHAISLMEEDVGIVFSEAKVIELDEQKNIELIGDYTNNVEKSKTRSIFKIPRVLYTLISPSAALVRREDAIRCMYMTTNLCSDHYYFGVGPDWLITALPLFNYKYCGYIRTPLVFYGAHAGSITIDASASGDKVKRRNFNKHIAGQDHI